jgi:DNA-binding PadR family transcriptional regulator
LAEKMITREKKPLTTGIEVYKESLRNLILRILAEKPAHGYEIMSKIQEMTDGKWRPAAGTVYPLLEQMKREGLIEVASVQKTGVRGGKRVTYTLTDKGWAALASLLLAKARSKVRVIEWMILEGAVLLKRNGYENVAADICEALAKSVETFREAVERNCS